MASIALSSTMAAPLIDPTSGLYRPPMVVTISPAQATGGVADLEDSTAHICYSVQRAGNAADVNRGDYREHKPWEWFRKVAAGEVEGKGGQAREGWRQFVSRHVSDAW